MMQVFKITTTVFLAIIIATMLGVLISKKDDKASAIVAGIISGVQIMAIASIWL